MEGGTIYAWNHHACYAFTFYRTMVTRLAICTAAVDFSGADEGLVTLLPFTKLLPPENCKHALSHLALLDFDARYRVLDDHW